MKYTVVAPDIIKGKVELPISKSMMNRYLALCHLSNKGLPASLDSWPEDVKILHKMLSINNKEINSQDAGTAMRFASAILSVGSGEHILVGSERMNERPIGPLVDALNGLGADVVYLKKNGFPPLSIKGKTLKGGSIVLPVDVSSQFLTALLMISCLCEKNVSIECRGRKVSIPYIDLTIRMMEEFGVVVEEKNKAYIINPQTYTWKAINIEKDWSSAAFIYQVCALSDGGIVTLPGLSIKSIQGDKQTSELFALLGVKSEEIAVGLRLSKTGFLDSKVDISVEFTDIPDLVQPFVMTCLALNVNLNLQGLYNLHLKESNRLEAIKHNVEALGGQFKFNGNEAKLISTHRLNGKAELRVFNDHRMAMALAPLALKTKTIVVPEIESVKKSFPNYWHELSSLGFELIEMA